MKTSLLRTSTTGLAIAVTAVLANALTGVAAQADETGSGETLTAETPADSTETEPTPEVVTTTPDPVVTTLPATEPTPAVTTTTPPAPTLPALSPTPGAITSSPTPTETTPAPDEEVEADYGFQKFRVGVRAADGTTSTVGSTFEITISGSTDPAEDSVDTCTTVATVEPRDDNASFCPPDAGPINPLRAAAGSVGTTREPLFTEGVRYAPAGATVTVRQLTAAPGSGLEITDPTGSVQPCTGTLFGAGSPCITGDDDGLPSGVYSTVLFVNEPPTVDPPVVDPPVDVDPDDDVSGDDVTDDEPTTRPAATDDQLPDTGAPAQGGSSAPLVGALVGAGGAAAVTAGLRRPTRARR